MAIFTSNATLYSAMMENIRLKCKIWLETGEGIPNLGDGKWRLLKEIHKTGPLKQAMINLNLTYRKTWDNLNKIEKNIGFPLIQRQRGGKEGGHTGLTREGINIVELFDAFHEEIDPIIREFLQRTAGTINPETMHDGNGSRNTTG